VLRKAHITDGGYFALNAIPQEVTYGKHAYEKGGVVANALRGYLGDSLFFDAMTAYLNNFAFQSVSSEDMRDFLTDYTGIDMAGFFDAWVFTPGSPHFSIDSTKVTPNTAGYQVDVWLKQKFKAADFLAQDVVSEITFVDEMYNEFTDTIHFSGKTGHSVKQLDFEPKAVFLDLFEKSCDATTDNFKLFSQPTEYSFPETYFKIFIDELDDLSMIQATHNWVAPDSLKFPLDGLKLSNYHYWKIDGIFPESYKAHGTFVYDRDGYLDGELIESEKDSVVILYREGSWDDWHEIEQSRYGLWDFGQVDVSDLQPGEYTLAVWDKQIVGTEEVPQQKHVNIYPNPNHGVINFEFEEKGKYTIILYDSKGSKLDQFSANGKSKTYKWSGKKAFTGVVFVHVYKGDERLTVKKLVFSN
jgi:aminopeptidase N